MCMTVTSLEPHPNDPTSPRPSSFQLPEPRPQPIYRLEAALGEPVDLGETDHGPRRIVPLIGGTFAGPAINGKLLPGASADVLARLARGDGVDASEYTFRTSTQIETAAAGLDWLNKVVSVSVGGRQPGGVIYETYLVR
jgi:Protein of unknown function (DUF3237)